VEVIEREISEAKMQAIQSTIDDMREYKHGLLDYLVFLIADNTSLNELHQEIGRYLGVEKHMLNRIYSTVKGDRVRSKSEVIIANFLLRMVSLTSMKRSLSMRTGNGLNQILQ